MTQTTVLFFSGETVVLDKVMLIGDKGSTTGLKIYGHVGAVDQNAVPWIRMLFRI